jgi:hypothetical protein
MLGDDASTMGLAHHRCRLAAFNCTSTNTLAGVVHFTALKKAAKHDAFLL